MADWRSRGKGEDSDMDDEPDRRQRGKRNHGRGSRGFDSRPEFGGPEDLGFPADFPAPAGFAPAGRDNERGGGDRGGFGGRGGGDRGFDGERGGFGGGRSNEGSGGFRPRPDGPLQEHAPAERGPRQLGTVKFFKGDKGFGFITPDEGGIDVFVHISAVERSGLTSLESGQRLSFATEPDRRGKGPKAVELQLEEGEA